MRFEQADGILDLRSFAAFKAGHIEGSTWLSWEELPESLNALPAAPAKLFLVGDGQEIEAASLFLDSKGYQVTGSLVISDPQSLASWQSLLAKKWVTGAKSKDLWSPSDLLIEFAAHFEAAKDKTRPTALDLGCGGGRDAIWLAKQGWQVTAIDKESRVIKRAKQLANRSGANVKWKSCDLKKAGCLPAQAVDLVLVMRFLNRELFSDIADLVKPGGWLVFQTFAEGAEAFGSPKNPNFLLKAGELKEVFTDFKPVVDRIDKIADGRPVASFIAQKQ